jgi:hypothetical protein
VDAQGLPEPTPTQPKLLEEVLKLVNGTSWPAGKQLWIWKLCPHAHYRRLSLMVYMNIRSWAPGTSSLQDELEKLSEKNICIVGGI